MIGNDVIDLELAERESNWSRKGFLNKIFTERERQFIAESSAKFVVVWLMWSMKESAYKIYNRVTGKRLFNPLHFECNRLGYSDAFGSVKCMEFTCFTKSKITPEMIETVACLSKEELDKVAFVLNFNIIKVEALPFAFHNGILKPISKSDHGRFVKIVCIN